MRDVKKGGKLNGYCKVFFSESLTSALFRFIFVPPKNKLFLLFCCNRNGFWLIGVNLCKSSNFCWKIFKANTCQGEVKIQRVKLTIKYVWDLTNGVFWLFFIKSNSHFFFNFMNRKVKYFVSSEISIG